MKTSLTNRLIQIGCILALFLIVFLLYLFLKSLPPAPTTPSNIAYLFYLDGNYGESIKILSEEIKKKPNDYDIGYLYAMALLRNQERNKAKAELLRLNALFPHREPLQIGLAEAYLVTGETENAIHLLEKLKEKNPRNSEVDFLLGDAYLKKGENFKAAALYQMMIEKGISKEIAKRRFLELTGYPEYHSDLKFDFRPVSKKENLDLHFRTQLESIQVLEASEWKSVYLKGVNLSTAAPGYFASDPPKEYAPYEKWIQMAADMNCNVIRLYTLAAPAFYHALKNYNETHEKKLWLYQEIWLSDRNPTQQAIKEAFNLYDSSWIEEFRQEISYYIDVIHGRGNVPLMPGRTGGIYLADISEYVVAFGVGNELLPYVAKETNEKNPHMTTFQGEYVRLNQGSPVEVWYANMCDFAAYYETSQYGAQRPLSIVNWPTLDPLVHSSEASFEQVNQWQKKYGLEVSQRPRIAVENDIATLDVNKMEATQAFQGGLFATYHVYPYWPDFLWADSKYMQSRDSQGHNPFYGYLLELKEKHKNIPLVLGEYGMSTSWQPVYFAENSVNEGGFSYQDQVTWLLRNSENILNINYAGGLVFELQDEWWHSSVTLTPLLESETKPLWFNVLDGEACYGVTSFRSPKPVPLLRGEPDDWENAQVLKKSRWRWPSPGEIKQAYVRSDFSFLYIRIDVEPWDNQSDLTSSEYWIALETTDQIGAQRIRGTDLVFPNGINFLVKLNGKKEGVLLTNKNYLPFEWKPASNILGGQELRFKKGLPHKIFQVADFEELIFPIRNYRISKDGTIYPQKTADYSALRYGTADPESREFDNRSAWHINHEKGMIEIRIPWFMLFISPPTRSAIVDISQLGAGLEEQAAHFEEIEGIKMAFISWNSGKMATFPKNDKGIIPPNEMFLYTWEKWSDIPQYDVIYKNGYFAMQELYNRLQ